MNSIEIKHLSKHYKSGVTYWNSLPGQFMFADMIPRKRANKSEAVLDICRRNLLCTHLYLYLILSII